MDDGVELYEPLDSRCLFAIGSGGVLGDDEGDEAAARCMNWSIVSFTSGRPQEPCLPSWSGAGKTLPSPACWIAPCCLRWVIHDERASLHCVQVLDITGSCGSTENGGFAQVNGRGIACELPYQTFSWLSRDLPATRLVILSVVLCGFLHRFWTSTSAAYFVIILLSIIIELCCTIERCVIYNL